MTKEFCYGSVVKMILKGLSCGVFSFIHGISSFMHAFLHYFCDMHDFFSLPECLSSLYAWFFHDTQAVFTICMTLFTIYLISFTICMTLFIIMYHHHIIFTIYMTLFIICMTSFTKCVLYSLYAFFIHNLHDYIHYVCPLFTICITLFTICMTLFIICMTIFTMCVLYSLYVCFIHHMHMFIHYIAVWYHKKQRN